MLPKRRIRGNFSPPRSLVALVLVVVMTFGAFGAAYRVGDDVDTELSIDGSPPSDVLRSQMPYFGVSSTANFQIKPTSHIFDRKIALSFLDGLWGLPTTYLTNSRGEGLVSILVTFVFSKSGSGVIHSVSSVPTYSSEGNDSYSVRVEYKWVEEEDIYVNAGQAIMFMLTFFVGAFLLIASCGLLEDSERDNHSQSLGRNGAEAPVPKWD